MIGEGSEKLRRRRNEMAEELRRQGDAEVDVAAAKFVGLINAKKAAGPVPA